MTKVWRVENAKGEGPYNCERCWPSQDVMKQEHFNNVASHPGFNTDFETDTFTTDRAEPYIFGFATKTQAFEWFAGWFGTLRAHGFELREIEAVDSSIIEGRSRRQVMFIRR